MYLVLAPWADLGPTERGGNRVPGGHNYPLKSYKVIYLTKHKTINISLYSRGQKVKLGGHCRSPNPPMSGTVYMQKQ